VSPMSLQATRTLLVVISAGVAVSVLYLAGCFASKLSAAETARQIRLGTNAAHVSCRDGDADWHYTCTVAYRDGRTMTIDADVDVHEITSQSAP